MLKAELFDELNYEWALPVLSSYIALSDIPVIFTNIPGFDVD